jgi:hypothetical protein
MDNAMMDLALALRERVAIIKDGASRLNPNAHMALLRAISEKIETLEAALPRPIDPRLAHYLERRSYDKALEYLDGIVGQA